MTDIKETILLKYKNVQARQAALDVEYFSKKALIPADEQSEYEKFSLDAWVKLNKARGLLLHVGYKDNELEGIQFLIFAALAGAAIGGIYYALHQVGRYLDVLQEGQQQFHERFMKFGQAVPAPEPEPIWETPVTYAQGISTGMLIAVAVGAYLFLTRK